jgi:hypothetical protein
VYDYVRKYAEYRMIKAQEKALEVSWIMCNRVCHEVFWIVVYCGNMC